ncbi:MAG TPA: hypothetical protein VMQ86_14930 [Bryobacteraceae bacterium]|jgi:hypothetical protein|nr:hypothetical protein [Bryobacteraceae bacterium]
MIQAMQSQRLEAMERPEVHRAPGNVDFAELFGDATKNSQPAGSAGLPSSLITPAGKPATPATSPATPVAQPVTPVAQPATPVAQPVTPVAQPVTPVGSPVSPAPSPAASPGDPNVQGWLNTYWAQQGNTDNANISYQPAEGTGSNFTAGTVYGPDAIYTQALANQYGNSFASMTGDNPAEFTSQLPGVPSLQVQQQFDQTLALENAGRLSSGQAIDTSAYWADPGSISMGGQTYTAQQLGYAGVEQSSGPQPIFISQANQIAGTDTFSVGGYNGTVTGITPGKYYTLQQLEQAGLQTGQPDGQYNPGSWTTTQSA